MANMQNWGPSHQTAPGSSRARRWTVRVLLAFAIIALGTGGRHPGVVTSAAGLILFAWFIWVCVPRRARSWLTLPLRWLLRGWGWLWSWMLMRGDRLHAVRRRAVRHGGGPYLGVTARGVRHARPQRAVLVLGPPRSGKTSSVMIPAVIAHTGPVVSTSTKPDVAHATRQARSGNGRVWVFDPTGRSQDQAGERLRWSPVQTAESWDAAMLTARALTSTTGAGTTDRSHWAHRAQALLAPLLHAAAVHEQGMDAVVRWVTRHDLDQPGLMLEDERCSELAFDTLLGIHQTEDRERSSIFSATADALQAYTSQAALATARDPNFDPHAFVRSADTVYIHAPAEDQASVAPVVCGLLSAIRRATYQAHATRQLTTGGVLFALDEVANIAPLQELPQIASEGGGQGLVLLAALQDLSQARQRWGTQAEGFLTLFGTKLILPGVADARTLDAISTTLGEYDRQTVSHTRPHGGPGLLSLLYDRSQPRAVAQASTTISTQRTRVLSPGEIASIPAGRALHLDGIYWELLTLTPAHRTQPWRTLTTPTT